MRTESQLDDAQDASNACHPGYSLSSNQGGIAQADVASRAIDRKGRSIGSRGGVEGVGIRRDLDINVPKGESHGGGIELRRGMWTVYTVESEAPNSSTKLVRDRIGDRSSDGSLSHPKSAGLII